MKQITTSVLLKVLMVCLLFSCGETNKKEQQIKTSTLETATTPQAKEVAKNTSSGTFLCKVNGEDWYYTSSNGLVSENSAIKVRTATIGFTKQLAKGTESIQLEYDVKKNVLNNIWVQLKRPNKEGQPITAFYTQYGDKLHLKPEASLSGTVNLDESGRKASGTAIFTIANDYEQDQLVHTEDLRITVTDLNFTDVAYSDTDDLKKMMKQ